MPISVLFRILIAVASGGVILAAVIVGCASPNTSDPNPRLRGYASWYGSQFQGRKTASGERFDMNSLTAAHRTLPFNTKIEVRSLMTGKIVVVRINDRGPFDPNRVLDLSRSAAEALGMINSGVTEVEFEPVP